MRRFWVVDWEIQCCGGTIRVGERVQWLVQQHRGNLLPTILGEQEAAKVTGVETHHGPGFTGSRTSGTVHAMYALFCRYSSQPSDQVATPVDGSGVMRRTFEGDGWEDQDDGLHFLGYLVDLVP